MDLLLLTQYFDMIKDLGGKNKANSTLFLPHGYYYCYCDIIINPTIITIIIMKSFITIIVIIITSVINIIILVIIYHYIIITTIINV